MRKLAATVKQRTSEHTEELPSRRISKCAVCGGTELETVIALPQLPLTALFSPKRPEKYPACYDQELQMCGGCGHAQAGYQVTSALLYDKDYGFRTSLSANARRGTDFFLGGLKELGGAQSFRCALDWGCNDLHLLRQLKDRAEIRVGIDPVWRGRETDHEDPDIQVSGALIEEVDLAGVFSTPPELILCRHTLEHIGAPLPILRRLFEFAADGALFVIEVPGFDSLVRRCRFDQIFHQHLQYFNLSDLQRVIHDLGGEYVGCRENYHDWGALLVAFRKSKAGRGNWQVAPAPFSIPEVRAHYGMFRRQLDTSSEILRSFRPDGPFYGYGAAQMLPVLAYHMQNDLSCLKAILDDDVSRDGWYYQNLAPPIRFAGNVNDLKEATVLVTAIDNVQPILRTLLAQRPKHLIIPFNLL